MKTPRPSLSSSGQSQIGAPRDVHERAKTLMRSLMQRKGLDADELWHAKLGGWILPTPTPTPLLVRLIRVEIPDEDPKKRPQTLDYLHVHLRLMRLPASGLLALYRFVLERNYDLSGVAFAVSGEHLVLHAQRELEGLDESELDAAIGAAVSAALHFGPILMEEFDLGAVPL